VRLARKSLAAQLKGSLTIQRFARLEQNPPKQTHNKATNRVYSCFVLLLAHLEKGMAISDTRCARETHKVSGRHTLVHQIGSEADDSVVLGESTLANPQRVMLSNIQQIGQGQRGIG
jgi:hypothetical protein